MRQVCLLLVLLVSVADARMPRRIPQLTIGPLAWDYTVDATKTALERAKMDPKVDEMRRYFSPTPDQPEVRHTTEPTISFSPRKGWTGLVHFSWDDYAKDYRMDRVTETAEAL